MSAMTSLSKNSILRFVWYQFSVSIVLSAPVFSLAYGQEPAEAPEISTEKKSPREVEAAPRTTEQQAPVDPRILRREEEERRERIEQLSRSQPQIPKEGDLLASPDIPRGLLPKRGIRTGRIIYLPSVNVGAIITDNANNDDEVREDDVLLGASAAIRAQTLLRRHQLGAEASATAGYSVEGIEEDFLDWEVNADGRYDLDRQNSLNASAATSLAREADSSAEADGNGDADLNVFSGNAGYAFNGRLLDFSLNGIVDREDFSGDNTADRDNTVYTATTRVTRKFGNRLSLFVAPAYAVTEFDEDVSNDGEDRDSYEITGLVGAEYRPRPRLRVGGSIGYSQAYFDDPDVDENGSVVGSLETSLAYDSRTDLALNARREVEVTTVDGSASETETTVSATATRLLAPKHAISTELTYLHTDFDGLSRTDQDITAGVDYFFRFSDHLIFNLGYQYLERFSDDADEDFYENQMRISVTLVY